MYYIMSMYIIQPYSLTRAEQLGVILKPSQNKNRKIDIYDTENNFICSCGDTRYYDFPYYLNRYGLAYAEAKRHLYHIKNKPKRKNTASYFEKEILW